MERGQGGSVELSGVDSAEEGEEAASSCLAGMHARRAPFRRCLLARETTSNGQLGRAIGWATGKSFLISCFLFLFLTFVLYLKEMLKHFHKC